MLGPCCGADLARELLVSTGIDLGRVVELTTGSGIVAYPLFQLESGSITVGIAELFTVLDRETASTWMVCVVVGVNGTGSWRAATRCDSRWSLACGHGRCPRVGHKALTD